MVGINDGKFATEIQRRSRNGNGYIISKHSVLTDRVDSASYIFNLLKISIKLIFRKKKETFSIEVIKIVISRIDRSYFFNIVREVLCYVNISWRHFLLVLHLLCVWVLLLLKVHKWCSFCYSLQFVVCDSVFPVRKSRRCTSNHLDLQASFARRHF